MGRSPQPGPVTELVALIENIQHVEAELHELVARAVQMQNMFVSEIDRVVLRLLLRVSESGAQPRAVEHVHVNAVVFPGVSGAGRDRILRLVIELDVMAADKRQLVGGEVKLLRVDIMRHCLHPGKVGESGEPSLFVDSTQLCPIHGGAAIIVGGEDEGVAELAQVDELFGLLVEPVDVQ